DASNKRKPERDRVVARVGDDGRANQQRDEVVGEADEERDDREQDHRHAVDREGLVVGQRIDEARLRRGELGAEEQRFEAADREEGDAHTDVEDADLFVVDGPEPPNALAGWTADPQRYRGHFSDTRYAASASSSGSDNGTRGMSAPGLYCCGSAIHARMSLFPPSSGTQKLWMTSADVRSRSTAVPIGMCISFAVVTGP